ncbi:MAG: hypothetical protein K6G57_07715 [Lachnospiraceae bacterium]|nr:hypothetical protein [Lachnospiraceae bacterium]
MIEVKDILPLQFLVKSDYSGSYKGMRYRLECVKDEEGNKSLACVVWPEPFNYATTSEDSKQRASFSFDKDGITDAVSWMNDKYNEKREEWAHASENWESYRMPKG